MARMLSELSEDERNVLAALPKEPLCHSVPDMAEDLFGGTHSVALSRVKRVLAVLDVEELVYIESRNTRPYGHKDYYGIRADRWADVLAMFADADSVVNDPHDDLLVEASEVGHDCGR